MSDHLVRGIVPGANLRVAACITTDLCTHAATVHKCEATSTIAFGRALNSALLAAAALLKGSDALNLHWATDGPIGSLFVDADGEGNVRGYVRSPFVKFIETEETRDILRPSIGKAFGREGLLHVVRDAESGQLWRGTVELASGEVDEDVARYLTESEQLPTALAADVVVDGTGRVIAAGGIVVSTLPGADVEPVAQLAERLAREPLAGLLVGNGAPRARTLLSALFGEGAVKVLDDRLVQYRCRCSRARAENAMSALSTDDLRAFIEASEPARVACDFCGVSYEFDMDALHSLIARREAVQITATS